MALAQMDFTIEVREVSLKNRPSELTELSSKSTVPVLHLQNGNVIDESLDIMFWCVKQKTDSEWKLTDLDYQKNLITTFDTDFKLWLDKYKYHDRHPENSIEYYQEQCVLILNQFKECLQNNRYLTGDSLQLVDAAIFPFVRQFAHVDLEWFSSRLPGLNRWLEEIKNSNLFISVMKKYKFWKSGDKPLVVNFSSDFHTV